MNKLKEKTKGFIKENHKVMMSLFMIMFVFSTPAFATGNIFHKFGQVIVQFMYDGFQVVGIILLVYALVQLLTNAGLFDGQERDTSKIKSGVATVLTAFVLIALNQFADQILIALDFAHLIP